MKGVLFLFKANPLKTKVVYFQAETKFCCFLVNVFQSFKSFSSRSRMRKRSQEYFISESKGRAFETRCLQSAPLMKAASN